MIKKLISFCIFLSLSLVVLGNKEPINKEEVDKIKKENLDYWYVDKTLKVDESENNISTDLSGINQLGEILMWLIIVVIVIAIVIYYSKNISKKSIPVVHQNKSKNTEPIISELKETDLLQNIKNAKEIHDFRMAIKWTYILLIKNLDDKGHISYNEFKTNADYCNELSKNKYLKENFLQLLKIYEAVWFGQKTIIISDFENFENHIQSTIKSL